MNPVLAHARRLVVAVVGITVLILGGLMLIGPGPGVLVVTLGLGILATEFVWAQRLLHRCKKAALNAKDKVMGTKSTNTDDNSKSPES